MPPFGRFAAIIFSGRNEAQVKQTAIDLRNSAPKDKMIHILGPAPAPLVQLKGKYRYRLLVHAPKHVNLQEYLRQWFALKPLPSVIQMKVDIDPYSFM